MEKKDNLPDNTSDNVPIYDTTNKNIPLQQLLELRAKGLSFNDIAKIVGCNKSNVHNRLKEYKEELEQLDSFKDNRADYFAITQAKLLNSIDESDIKRMAPASRITGAAILYDKERLERGKSTANVSYADMCRDAAQLEAEIAQLRQELGMPPLSQTIDHQESTEEE
jgi:hypothetical protein